MKHYVSVRRITEPDTDPQPDEKVTGREFEEMVIEFERAVDRAYINILFPD